MPRCSICDNFYMGASCPYCAEEMTKKAEKAAAEDAERKRLRDAFIFSTTSGVVGYRVTSQLGVVTGSTVLGTGFLSELRADFSDAFGMRSGAFSNKLDQAKDDAFDLAFDKARALGANAMIGVDVKFSTFSDNMIAAIVTGTAVVVMPE